MLVRKTKYQKLTRVRFAPDGLGLVAAGKFGAYWWPSVFDDAKPHLFGTDECGGVGITPDGAYILASISAGYQKTDVYAISTATREKHTTRIEKTWVSLGVCPVTGIAVTESWSWFEMIGWRVGADGALVQAWKVPARFGSIGSSVAFASGGKWFARATREEGATDRYLLALHDTATGAQLRTCPGSGWVSAGPAVSPDGEWIAFANGSSLCAQSTTDARKQKYARNDNTHQFTGLAYHPGGAFLAVTNNDETVKLYDTTSWKPVRTFTWDIGKMRSVCFSPDGTLAAAGSDKGKVIVWDVDL